METSTRILVVEDSKFFSNIVKKSVIERTGATVVTALSLAETKAAVERADAPFNLALVDVILPDCQEGEAIDWLLKQGVPCIVFTGVFSDDLRERLLAQNVIDYVVKGNPSSLEHLMRLVERIHRNRDTKILVVDDSKTARHYLVDLLTSYQFQVVTAENGREGLAALDADPGIRMVITDYHMPEMDGVEMVKRIRQNYDQDRLAIIGISSGGGNALSARFIKFGANDYINKPFLREEFFCRVTQNIQMLELVQRLSDMATKDALTGIHNRRFLFEAGESLFANAKRSHLTLTAAMLDVDFFKKVNDTYGHDGGDVVLKRVAARLRSQCRQTDIVARFGGEEFAILSVNMDADSIEPFFESLRKAIEDEVISLGLQRIKVTASFGVCATTGTNLAEMLKTADEMLYRAKANGRNRVEIAGLADPTLQTTAAS
ncbi:Response regulator receiver modulated diguanylate cyclase [Magnetospirillum sp. LM-5]|uniref:diguanylate cyclase n=1 Tax=Magnetospirillum sp. LM-5 TaxID=2681466 RepID=UPI00138395C0|nr:diguanylate cyclase [Magnetospirillum sp. LM-5]CAA7622198.1 Response regulator receiver modulated diguanylate cyclase [Magnetospirillum sp. LM-5]